MGRFILLLILLVIVALVLLFGGFLGLGFGLGGRGSGSGQGSGPAKPVEEKVSDGPIVDGILFVTIDGGRLQVQNKSMSAEEIAELASKHDAKVVVKRSADALRQPREDIEKTLRQRNVHYVLE